MSAYDKRREALARLIAASTMGLRDDATGAGLPIDLWRGYLPDADAILIIINGVDREAAGAKMEGDHYNRPG